MNKWSVLLGVAWLAAACSAATGTTGGAAPAADTAASDTVVAVEDTQPSLDIADETPPDAKDAQAPSDIKDVQAAPDVAVADVPTVKDINGQVCGTLVGPDLPSCCICGTGKTCAKNGCYGGWFCNAPSCKCQAAPATCDAPDANASDTGNAPDAVAADASGKQTVGPTGGTLDSLDFAIVGDTRPPSKDDVASYPTAVITQIFKDVQAETPALPFVITTGDYQFSSPSNGNSATTQFDLYLQAQANYGGFAYHTMGNHECTGAVVSNCGTGNADGLTQTYQTFMQKLMAPMGLTKPWYVINFKASDGSWTAKFVVIAANAWSSEQATWLENAMSKPTTYTFVVRHEGVMVTTAPGVTPSAAIIAKYPFTLLLVGHTHTFDYYASDREVITGNGGAPLATGVNYGYTVVRQRPDAALEITAYDYETHGIIQTFAVKADGTPTK